MTIEKVASRRNLFDKQETLLSGGMLPSENRLRYTNAALCCSDSFIRTLLFDYAAGEINTPDVSLGWYPPRTLILGGSAFYPVVGNAIAAEQIIPAETDPVGRANALIASIHQVEDVADPCILVARFGAGTWGHWLGEILPRAAIAEHFFPGRFRFAVPHEVTLGGGTDKYSTLVLQSFAAFGIAEDRLLRLLPDRHYRFAALADVPGVEMVNDPSPDVLSILRQTVQPALQAEHSGCDRIALLRRPGDSRPIYNQPEIVALLEKRGFECVDNARLSFIEQARLAFRCRTMFSTWGSSFIWMMFAQPDVRVVSVSPADWFDGYFRGLIKVQKARFADIRGPVLWDGNGLRRDAPFYVSPHAVEQALEALDPASQTSDPEILLLAGTATPRRLGAVTHVLVATTAAGTGTEPWEGSGWSGREPLGTWSVGPRSELIVPRAWVADDFVLEIAVNTLLMEPHVVTRPLTLSLDNKPIQTFTLGGASRILCAMPATPEGGDQARIGFEHPLHPPPAALGFNADARQLAFLFSAIRFRSAVK